MDNRETDNQARPLPADFIAMMNRVLGDQAQALLDALHAPAPASIRVNASKIEWANSSPVDWCDDAYYLDGRLTYTFDPLFHAGAYYAQEASSMFISHIAKTLVKNPVLALDLCAAPGGKSTALLSSLPAGSLLVANEAVRNRVPALLENIAKWGNPSVIVTNNQTADFAKLGGMFDFILVDAPCSGEGMFRKDAKAIDEWSLANVAMCARRQKKILADAWQALKPGGILAYSTCTFNLEENENNVHWMVEQLGATPVYIDTNPAWYIAGALDGTQLPAFRFMPHRTRGEGLFMAVLSKDANATQPPQAHLRAACKEKKTAAIPQAAKNLVNPHAATDLHRDGDTFVLFPKHWMREAAIIKSALRQAKAGIKIAMLKGGDCIPTHLLAMCTHCNREIFAQAELNYADAIEYIRRGQITLPPSAKGYAIVTYAGIPLGFVKNLGNRCNNLYPNDYRIMATRNPGTVRLLVDTGIITASSPAG